MKKAIVLAAVMVAAQIGAAHAESPSGRFLIPMNRL